MIPINRTKQIKSSSKWLVMMMPGHGNVFRIVALYGGETTGKFPHKERSVMMNFSCFQPGQTVELTVEVLGFETLWCSCDSNVILEILGI